MSKVDVILSAEFSQTLVANTDNNVLVVVNTLSDATIFQVLEIVAIEVLRMGTVLTGANPVRANLQLLTADALQELPPLGSEPEFLAQFGQLYGAGSSAMQERIQLTTPVVVSGAAFKVGSFIRSAAAGSLYTGVKVYGNYTRMREVDYLRLTCGG